MADILMTEFKKPRVLKLLGKEIPIPASRIGRIVLGVLFVLMGLLGFLPILGFWMIPVGLLILSQDLAMVRRWRRRFTVWYAKRKMNRPAN